MQLLFNVLHVTSHSIVLIPEQTTCLFHPLKFKKVNNLHRDLFSKYLTYFKQLFKSVYIAICCFDIV